MSSTSVHERVGTRLAGALFSLAFVISQLAYSPSASAAAGALDTSFGFGGRMTTEFGSGEETGLDVAVQPDGKIVVVGESDNGDNFDFAIARYKRNGTLDPSFSEDGKLSMSIGLLDDHADGVMIQPDGKIVIAGRSFNEVDFDFAVVRLNSDGIPDPTFDTDGVAVTDFSSSNDYAYGVALQDDGKIVLVGTTFTGTSDDLALARYNSNGTPDVDFGTGGEVVTPVGAGTDIAADVAIQTDGKIVIAGYTNSGPSCDNQGTTCDFLLARYLTNGDLDGDFGVGGKVITDFGGESAANALAIQADGKIVAAGFSIQDTGDFALARYTGNGTPDSAFDDDGKVTTSIGALDSIWGVEIQTDGKIVAGGFSNSGVDTFALARYLPGGSLDAAFDIDGKVTTRFGTDHAPGLALALQPDGKAVVAGKSYNGDDYDFALARYRSGQEVFRPDGLIGQTAGPLIGGNIYNRTGANQTRSVNAKRGTKKSFVARVENDGNDTDTILLKGPGNSRGFKVKYFSGTSNITSGVIDGEAGIRNAGPGKFGTFRIEVSVTEDAAVGATKTILMTLTSLGDRTKRDAVKAKVTVISGR